MRRGVVRAATAVIGSREAGLIGEQFEALELLSGCLSPTARRSLTAASTLRSTALPSTWRRLRSRARRRRVQRSRPCSRSVRRCGGLLRHARRERHREIDSLLTARLLDRDVARQAGEGDELRLQRIASGARKLQRVRAIDPGCADVDGMTVSVNDRYDHAGQRRSRRRDRPAD